MSDIEKNVEFGLASIDTKRTIELPLKDALYAYKVLGELIAFFHQPGHWQSIEDVQRFMGDRHNGALHVLWEAYYCRLHDVWPADIQQAFDDGRLDRSPFLD